jgi:hypothetical protein
MGMVRGGLKNEVQKAETYILYKLRGELVYD